MYRFRIEGKIKPYVRMTQRGKWVKPEAIAYRNSQRALKLMLKNQMIEHDWKMLPGQTPLIIGIWISPADHRRDLDNEIKALLDAMSGVAFPDDRWVDSINACRLNTGPDQIDIVLKTIRA